MFTTKATIHSILCGIACAFTAFFAVVIPVQAQSLSPVAAPGRCFKLERCHSAFAESRVSGHRRSTRPRVT